MVSRGHIIMGLVDCIDYCRFTLNTGRHQMVLCMISINIFKQLFQSDYSGYSVENEGDISGGKKTK